MKQRRQLLEQELKRLGKQMSQGPLDNQVTLLELSYRIQTWHEDSCNCEIWEA